MRKIERICVHCTASPLSCGMAELRTDRDGDGVCGVCLQNLDLTTEKGI